MSTQDDKVIGERAVGNDRRKFLGKVVAIGAVAAIPATAKAVECGLETATWTSGSTLEFRLTVELTDQQIDNIYNQTGEEISVIQLEVSNPKRLAEVIIEAEQL